MTEWDSVVAKLTSEDWQEIENINSQIQSHSTTWGEMKGGEKDDSGVIEMPYADADPLIRKFVELWYDKDLVVPFDWSKWDEGRKWYADTSDQKYKTLDQEKALKLLTAVIRNDRFNEGALLRAFEDGEFPKIINTFVGLRKK